MHEDKNTARIDQLQVMINDLRKDLEGFKKEQAAVFDAKLSVLEKSIAFFELK